MSRLSFRLAKALSDGREARGRPLSREEVLSRLLMKRAMAHRAGLTKLEAALRGQIAWALPVRQGEAPGDEVSPNRSEADREPDAQALDDRL